MLASVIASGTMGLRGLPYLFLFYCGALVLGLVAITGAVFLAIQVYRALTDNRPRDGLTVGRVERDEGTPT